MQVVPSTTLALVVLLALAVLGPHRGLWVFLATTPFGAAAAFNLPAAGGASILVTDLGALMMFAMLWVQPDAPARITGTMRAFQPGFWMLLFVVVCVLSALFFPRLFQGATNVFGLSRANNQVGIVEIPLHPTNGNLTQLFRIFLDAAAFFALATAFRLRPEARGVVVALAVASFINAALGWLDVLSFDIGMPTLLKPIQSANYAILSNVSMAGLKRMIGGFPEASAFGYYTLGLFAFWLHMWVARGRSWLISLALIVTTVALLRSTSSSAYVAAGGFMLVYGVMRLMRREERGVSRRGLAVTLGLAGGILLALMALWLAYLTIEPVSAFLDRSLFDKMGTASGVERMSWNTQAWVNFLDTRGFGAGLGSMRASNWLLASLGSIGAIGTGLFLIFFVTLARAPEGTEPGRAAVIGALKSGCLALFISANLTAPTPDLGVFFFAMAGLATGLSRGAARESLEQQDRGGSEDWRRPRTNPRRVGGL